MSVQTLSLYRTHVRIAYNCKQCQLLYSFIYYKRLNCAIFNDIQHALMFVYACAKVAVLRLYEHLESIAFYIKL